MYLESMEWHFWFGPMVIFFAVFVGFDCSLDFLAHINIEMIKDEDLYSDSNNKTLYLRLAQVINFKITCFKCFAMWREITYTTKANMWKVRIGEECYHHITLLECNMNRNSWRKQGMTATNYCLDWSKYVLSWPIIIGTSKMFCLNAEYKFGSSKQTNYFWRNSQT